MTVSRFQSSGLAKLTAFCLVFWSVAIYLPESVFACGAGGASGLSTRSVAGRILGAGGLGDVSLADKVLSGTPLPGYVDPAQGGTVGLVLLKDGKLLFAVCDLSQPGNIPLYAVRVYNSGAAATDVGLGRGWRFSYQRTIVVSQQDHIDLTTNTGVVLTFPYVSGTYPAPTTMVTPHEYFEWDSVNSVWLDQLQDGSLHSYASEAGSWRLSAYKDANGNKNNLYYDRNGLLTKAASDSGSEITATITSSHYSQLEDSAGRTVSYAYDGSNNLTRVTDANGNATALAYDGGNRLTHVQDAAGNAVAIYYNMTGKVTKVSNGLE